LRGSHPSRHRLTSAAVDLPQEAERGFVRSKFDLLRLAIFGRSQTTSYGALRSFLLTFFIEPPEPLEPLHFKDQPESSYREVLEAVAVQPPTFEIQAVQTNSKRFNAKFKRFKPCAMFWGLSTRAAD
jgi:hypothetical protein